MWTECGVIQSIFAEALGTLVMSSIILSGNPVIPHEHVRNHSMWDDWRDHDLTLTGRKRRFMSALDNAIEQGLVVAASGTFVTHLSGGHLNPAITVGALICRYIKVIPAICYIVAQIVASLIGQVIASLITDNPGLGRGHDIYLAEESDFSRGLLASFLLVSVFLSAFDPRKYARDVGSVPLAVGLCLTGTLYILTDYRHCMNPALSLATSVHYGDFRLDWEYWISPLLGGVLAGVVYRIITKNHIPSFVHVIHSKELVTITARNET